MARKRSNVIQNNKEFEKKIKKMKEKIVNNEDGVFSELTTVTVNTLEKSIKDDVARFKMENSKEDLEEDCNSLQEDWPYFMMTGLPGKMSSDMKSLLKGSLKARWQTKQKVSLIREAIPKESSLNSVNAQISVTPPLKFGHPRSTFFQLFFLY